MSINNSWVNEYHSLLQLKQDPTTGMLSGLYSSTTGGIGTYDVVGWASLHEPTEQAGQPMAISVLWRSDDGGKSDPSHEVSAMAGQVINMDNKLQLSLVHIFVETDPNSAKIEAGFYPDKLIFLPKESTPSLSSNIGPANPDDRIEGVNVEGIWLNDNDSSELQSLQIVQSDIHSCTINGFLKYKDGSQFALIGFTDNYATNSKLSKQSIGFSSYIDNVGSRTCISFAGYFEIDTGKLYLNSLHANATSNDANYTQVRMDFFQLYKDNSQQ
ncbi:avidin/streptavidin family protein [Sediminibacterium sp. TEGAF015]|uniref:avidin/streptavidin family protein n=1 Tax=Sediminibacterium sp. TEGAF015 TaxID=575378 RepID=UPI002200E9A0|nr:avidin/streptavidin family protein [Sediminibacterium sp. TEGAF015]BDQ11407.1 hypothetical protein TEGAF0_06240 [Sediminibacterium sp. TEGAF015]